MDAMTDEGVVIRQHIYRVRDARDAHQTVHRHHTVDRRLDDDTSKHILVDLPTNQCEEFLKLQVRLCFIYKVVKKVSRRDFCSSFVKCWRILKIISMAHSVVNLQYIVN